LGSSGRIVSSLTILGSEMDAPTEYVQYVNRISSQEMSSEFKGKIVAFLQKSFPEIDPEQVIIEDFAFVWWNDSSLGISEEGKRYLQVITPGYRVQLRVGELPLVLHTNEDANYILFFKS
jgi:hypothetical protein